MGTAGACVGLAAGYRNDIGALSAVHVVHLVAIVVGVPLLAGRCRLAPRRAGTTRHRPAGDRVTVHSWKGNTRGHPDAVHPWTSTQAREFLRSNPRAVLATMRRDGTPQMSPVLAGVDDEGRLVISSGRQRSRSPTSAVIHGHGSASSTTGSSAAGRRSAATSTSSACTTQWNRWSTTTAASPASTRTGTTTGAAMVPRPALPHPNHPDVGGSDRRGLTGNHLIYVSATPPGHEKDVPSRHDLLDSRA